MLDLSHFSVVSFDCYGTMIDWEAGIFSALRPILAAHNKRVNDAEVRSLPESLAGWEPFPDTTAALRELKTRYQLAVISNIDDDLFASTAPKLGVAFDQVITAQQALCYKPCKRIFQIARGRLGVSTEQWLHVGQSIYHDVIPAQAMGIAAVWVNRPSPRAGAGATKAAEGKPDLEVASLQALVELVGRV
jgi:2-haloacid dehalogenase